MKQRIPLLILAIILLIALTSCMPTGSTGGEKPGGKEPTEKPFFDLSNLNYNAAYQNAVDSSEKGFILFDSIDFNLIAYTAIPSRTPIFEVFYAEELIETIQMSPYGTVYSDYVLEKTGEYTIKIYTKIGGQSKEGQFSFKVLPGGYPDRVEFELLNSQRQIVSEAVGGESYTLRAKVFSGNTLLDTDNEKFSSAWSGGNSGAREKTVEIANHISDSQLNISFNYTCILPSSSKNMSSSFNVPIKNNYQGIDFSYGQRFVDGAATLDAAEGAVNFLYFSTAKHVFKNGDEENISVQYQANPQIGEVAVFIKYNGDSEHHRYARNIYNIAGRFTNYISNGTVYQLDPAKDSAEIYLALCYKEEHSGGYSLKYQKIEGSDAHITITKSTPDSINVPWISGMEKPEDNNSGNVSFSDRTVENNAVEVKVMVTENYIGGASKQHFKPEVTLNGSFSMGDYFFEIENITGVLRYNSIGGYFFAEQAGVAAIKIKSCFGSAEYTFTVNIVNPILSYEIELREKDYSRIPNCFCAELDIAPYIAVIQNYYNNTRTWRRMTEIESLKYYEDSIEKSVDDYVFRNEIYIISIKLFENDQQKAKNSVGYSFFIFPDFYIEIDGNQHKMSQMDKVRRAINVRDEGDKSLDFIGGIPEMSVNLPVGEQVEINLSGAPEGAEIQYLMGIDAHYIYYRGFYRYDGFLKRDFDPVLIAMIPIVRTE